jgi:predicted Zn-dependent peptidase
VRSRCATTTTALRPEPRLPGGRRQHRPARTAQRIRELFGPMPRVEERREPLAEPPPQGERRATLRTPHSVTRLCFGFPTCRMGERDDYALDVLAHDLGNSKNSRLYRRLVLKDELVTDVHVINETRQEPGALFLMCELRDGVQPAKVEAIVREEIRAQIDEGVAKKDLARIRRRSASSFLFQDEAVLDLAMKLGRFEAGTPGGYRTLATVLPTYDSLTQRRSCAPSRRSTSTSTASPSSGRCRQAPGRRRVVEGRRQEGRARAEGGRSCCQEARCGKAAKKGDEQGKKAKKADRADKADRGKPQEGQGHQEEEEARMTVPIRLTIAERELPSGLTLAGGAQPRRADLCLRGVARHPRRRRAGRLRSGLANLVGECLDEGTERHDALELSAAVESLGAMMDGNHRGGVVMSPAAVAKDATALLHEMVLEPAFPGREVRRVQAEVLTEIKAEEDDPRSVARGASARRSTATIRSAGRPPAPQERGEAEAEGPARVPRDWFRPAGGFVACAGPEDPERHARSAGEGVPRLPRQGAEARADAGRRSRRRRPRRAPADAARAGARVPRSHRHPSYAPRLLRAVGDGPRARHRPWLHLALLAQAARRTGTLLLGQRRHHRQRRRGAGHVHRLHRHQPRAPAARDRRLPRRDPPHPQRAGQRRRSCRT